MSVDGRPLPDWKHSRPGGAGQPADAGAWDRWYAADHGWSPPSSTVRSALNGLRPGRALDLGSGDGRHAVWLAGRGWHVKALDFSAEAADIGLERALAKGVTGLIEWIITDFNGYAPDPGSLDLVLAAFLDLPGPDLERLITGCVPGLAPGGLFLYIGHDPEDPWEGTAGPRDPATLHHRDQVAAWAAAAGLEVDSAETLPRPVPGYRRTALDCVVLARNPAAGTPPLNAHFAKNTEREAES